MANKKQLPSISTSPLATDTNLPKPKHAGGRPVKYKTNAEVQEVVDRYFNECDLKDKPYTMSGLALELDISRETLCQYTNKDEFSDTLLRARQKVQSYAEGQLYRTQGTVNGVIFSLSNNFGWSSKSETESKNINATVDLSGLSIEDIKKLLSN